jgi:hypothetical protein
MTRRTIASLVGALLVVALALPSVSGARLRHVAKGSRLACSGNPGLIHTFSLRIPAGQRTTGLHDHPGTVATGIYALPARRPRGLVLFAHGHNNTPEQAWEGHLRDAARSDGVIAVAMDYYDPNPPSPLPAGVGPKTYGWRVAEGADFSVAAARAFEAACHPRTTVMYGVSMGGNTAGLAVAKRAKRPNGKGPVFDYLFDIEGVMNVTETYLEAAATRNYAQGEIEEEMGGSPAQAPDAYRQRTVVSRMPDLEASGVHGVVIVQAVDDGLVPYDQTREFAAGLAAAGLPVALYTVGTRGKVNTANPNPLNLTGNPGCATPDECQTTADGYVTGNVPGFVSPFAGHGWEGSTTQVVIMTGLSRLAALLNHGQRPHGYHEYFVDPNTGTNPPPAG